MNAGEAGSAGGRRRRPGAADDDGMTEAERAECKALYYALIHAFYEIDRDHSGFIDAKEQEEMYIAAYRQQGVDLDFDALRQGQGAGSVASEAAAAPGAGGDGEGGGAEGEGAGAAPKTMSAEEEA